MKLFNKNLSQAVKKLSELPLEDLRQVSGGGGTSETFSGSGGGNLSHTNGGGRGGETSNNSTRNSECGTGGGRGLVICVPNKE